MKKKLHLNLIRILCAAVAALMLFSVLIGCARQSDDPAQTTGGAEATTADSAEGSTVTAEPHETTLSEQLGFDKELNYNGDDFVIFTWSNQTQFEWIEEDAVDNADIIKKAIYQRKIHTEEFLNINIKIISEPGEWNNRTAFIQKAQASINNNDKAYDLVGQYTAAAPIGAMYSLYRDLNSTEYFNAEQPWWPGDIVTNASINKKLYFVTGDITPTLIRSMGTMMYNISLGTSLGLPDVYELVDNKQWTMAKMQELFLGAYAVGGADGTQTYSITFSDNVAYDNIFYAGGFRYVDVDEVSGTQTISETLAGQPIVDWFDTCRNLLFNNADVELVSVPLGFAAGKSLLHMGNVAEIQNHMREVDDFEFAIIPAPMRDEHQDQYYTINGFWVSFYSIPTDARDPSMSSAGLEALCYYGSVDLTPTFYEDAFQLRYLESEANARMFDLLHDTLTYDTGRLFADNLNVFGRFRDAAKSSTSSWTTIYVNKNVWEKALEQIITTLG